MPRPGATKIYPQAATDVAVRSALDHWVASSGPGPPATEEGILQGSGFSLPTFRNRPVTLAPINTLPPEILSDIFALSGPNCAHSRFLGHNFACVCTYWRRTSLDTPELWSHIDAGPCVPRSITNLLLERAKASSLHVHAYEPEAVSETDDGSRGSLHAKRAIETLTPRVRRICTLRISSYIRSQSFVDSVVNFWLDQGNSNLTRSLTVLHPYCYETPYLDAWGRDEVPKPLSGNAAEVLLSIHTLRLYDGQFNWESSTYRGLVDLQIGFARSKNVAAFITTSELAGILTASPMMVVLKLGHVIVTRTDNWAQPLLLCSTV